MTRRVEAMELFVPGRICLFGEHSDWAAGYRQVNPDIEKGYTLICGTDQGIYAQVEPHPDSLILTATTPKGTTIGPYQIPMKPEVLLSEAKSGGFWSYIAGVSYQALTRFGISGLVVNNTKTDLPLKKGLSSSAAICVLTARAFNRLYGLDLSIRQEMELAYQGEITTPSQCGRMDQGCAYGKQTVLMSFDGEQLDIRELRIPNDLHLVIVDLGAEKDTKKILKQLNAGFPYPQNQVQQRVQRLFGPINKRIVHQAVEALETSNAARLGALMVEAQKYFDQYAIPACPDELRAPVLHQVLQYAPLGDHVWGGKGVGSQGDGAVQFVARGADDQAAAIEIIEGELGMSCLRLTIRGASAPVR